MNRKNGRFNLKTKIILTCFVLIILIVCSPFVWYKISTSPVSSKENATTIDIEIPLGSSSESIAKLLEEKGIIKSEIAYRLYIKLNNISGFQAGNYTFTTSLTLDEISNQLKNGIVFSNEDFTVTFLEGKSMKKYAKKISEVTNNTEDDVYNLLKDTTYLQSVIDDYWFITDEILNTDIYYPLEGYLFPDTYTFASKDISVKDIFKIMLDQMGKVLDEYKYDIENGNYSVHELLTMASVVELEAVKEEDRKTVAGVFYNRLNINDSLGSDVTTYYAIGVELGERDLWQYELDDDNAYNTRGPNMNGKLPIGPIASVGRNSIEAAIYPQETNYLFFVADKYGKLYFSNTSAEHSQITQQLINNNMWIEFE